MHATQSNFTTLRWFVNMNETWVTNRSNKSVLAVNGASVVKFMKRFSLLLPSLELECTELSRLPSLWHVLKDITDLCNANLWTDTVVCQYMKASFLTLLTKGNTLQRSPHERKHFKINRLEDQQCQTENHFLYRIIPHKTYLNSQNIFLQYQTSFLSFCIWCHSRETRCLTISFWDVLK